MDHQRRHETRHLQEAEEGPGEEGERARHALRRRGLPGRLRASGGCGGGGGGVAVAGGGDPHCHALQEHAGDGPMAQDDQPGGLPPAARGQAAGPAPPPGAREQGARSEPPRPRGNGRRAEPGRRGHRRRGRAGADDGHEAEAGAEQAWKGDGEDAAGAGGRASAVGDSAEAKLVRRGRDQTVDLGWEQHESMAGCGRRDAIVLRRDQQATMAGTGSRRDHAIVVRRAQLESMDDGS